MKIHTWSTMTNHDKIKMLEKDIKFTNYELLTDVRATLLIMFLSFVGCACALIFAISFDIWFSGLAPVIQAGSVMIVCLSFWFWVKFVRL